MTLTDGSICAHGGLSVAQLTALRVSAMVSPAAFGTKAPVPEGMVFGKGTPAALAPAQTEANRPLRPCDTGFCAPPCGRWQPLQLTVSPGCTCSHTPCSGVM